MGMISSSSPTTILLHSCHYCNKKFRFKNNWVSHEQAHEPAAAAAAAARTGGKKWVPKYIKNQFGKYSCNHPNCLKEFSKNYNLLRHMKNIHGKNDGNNMNGRTPSPPSPPSPPPPPPALPHSYHGVYQRGNRYT